ncbi:MAG: HD domain-containing protein [Candidatus Moranbacteria bacterium]|nr:HD domain-containing protein [Candidatus Moranbacteria bacterium]
MGEYKPNTPIGGSAERKQYSLFMDWTEYDEVRIGDQPIKFDETREEEDHEAFSARLLSAMERGELNEEDVERIEFAYDIAKAAHRNQARESGERYFEHLRAAALILMDEAKIFDRDMIIAALLHDAGEDTGIFGNITKSYEKWRQRSRLRLGWAFNERTADMVIAVTKPSIDGILFHDKAEAGEFYHRGLDAASPETILIKMADRLHNLRTLSDTPPEKQRKQIKETREIYWPLFEKTRQAYPDAVEYLLGQMEQVMKEIEAGLA